MGELDSPFFKSMRIENGLRILDLAADMDKYELLSEIFHTETMRVDRDDSIVIVKNENKRYFGDNTLCYKCGETGHISRACQKVVERSCMFCDLYHANKPCDYMFCYSCHNFGHKEKYCREKKTARFVCKSCPAQLHYECDCPKDWRRYKILNTSVKPGFKMSCAYCHSLGHFIDDCKMKDCQVSIFTRNYRTYLGKAPKKNRH